MYVEIGDIGYTFKKDTDRELILLDARFCVSNVNTSLLEIPETVVLSDGIEYKVTKVASRSLDRINLFKEIRFPNSIIEIPVYCFYECNKVEKLIFGYGITTQPNSFTHDA